VVWTEDFAFVGKTKKDTIMRALSAKLILAAALVAFPGVMRCGAQLVLGWNLSPDPTVTGYYLVWGLSSGDYTSTNSCSADQTTAEVDGLTTNQVYYFNIAAFNSSGMVSPYAGEVMCTNSSDTNALASSGTGATNSGTGTTNAGPPSPGGPGVPGTNTPPIVSSPPTSTNSTPPAANTNLTQSLFWGVPPFLTLAMSNGQPNLNIGGTVGATLMVESTTNLFSLDRWSEVTNVSVTNIAPVAQNNPETQPQDALDMAYVPGLQTLPMAPANLAGSQFFRVVMPYDYVILASIVLPSKGYTPRLIVVNMPGIVSDDACYVNESSSFIHFDRSTYAVQLQGCGSTIRQIAARLSSSLNLNWTSASEFTYSNGLGQILATVVETEPPSTDPIAGKAPASPHNAIDF
jgi:hypothetical protein